VKLHLVCGARGNRVWQYVLPLTWLLTLPAKKEGDVNDDDDGVFLAYFSGAHKALNEFIWLI